MLKLYIWTLMLYQPELIGQWLPVLNYISLRTNESETRNVCIRVYRIRLGDDDHGN